MINFATETRPTPPEGYEWFYIAASEKCRDCDLESGSSECQQTQCDQAYHGAYRLTHDIPWHYAAVVRKDRRKYDRGDGFMA